MAQICSALKLHALDENNINLPSDPESRIKLLCKPSIIIYYTAGIQVTLKFFNFVVIQSYLYVV